jgi:cytochrome c-type biogenesis protein CcmH/NrfF
MSMAHVMKAVDAHLLPRVYAAAAVFWSYPILFIILIACWRTRRYEKLERPTDMLRGG